MKIQKFAKCTHWIVGLVIASSLISYGGELVKAGDEIAELKTKSGRVYQSVVVNEVLPTGLRIRHTDGTETIPSAQLPQYAQTFASVQLPDTALPEPIASVKEPDPTTIWTPASVDDVMDCSLLVKVIEKVDKEEGVGGGGGSAFLVNHGKSTYIYSNVHNFDGTRQFEIFDRNGTRYTDFVSVEVAADGFGYYQDNKWGGDILRIQLSQYRPKALTIDTEFLTTENSKSRNIVVTGNTRDKGVITRLEGVIESVDQYGVINHTASTEAGNSGSPIVDLKTFKVLGIFTWGNYDSTRPLDEIWLKDKIWLESNPNTRESKGAGAGLAGVKYVPCDFEKLYSQRIRLNELKKSARLMGLMDTLIPTKQGLFLDRNAIVMGDYKVEDILIESSKNPVLKELVGLSAWLEKRGESKIGISNQDMLKVYIPSYERCLAHIQRQRKEFIRPQELTFFMKCKLKNTRALDISLAYEKATANSIQWLSMQRGARGQALPLGQRLRLPSFTDGLSALGLGDE